MQTQVWICKNSVTSSKNAYDTFKPLLKIFHSLLSLAMGSSNKTEYSKMFRKTTKLEAKKFENFF